MRLNIAKSLAIVWTILVFISACSTKPANKIATIETPLYPNEAISGKSLPVEKISPSPSVSDKCSDERGIFEFFEIPSSVMNYPIEGRIYLPPCYGVEIDRRYPVLYFLHGQSFNDDQWDRLGADESLDAMVLTGEIEPFIIVMPKETNYLNNQWDSKYGISLAEELVPYIDAQYRTVPERDARAIGGLSRGAAWAMRVGMLYWETFSAIGCHSFAPFRGDYNEAPFWFKEIPKQSQHRIYIDMGFLDVNLDPAYLFETRLVKYGVPHEWHVFHGTHNEAYWSTHVDEYIFWYAQGWK